MAVIFSVSFIIALALAGAIYQAIAIKLVQRKYPPSGRLVDIGGYRLHISCSESEYDSPGPTVVLDAGLGDCSLTWGLVQSEISKFVRVCAYDRAGLGWSDSAFTPRTSRQIVKELHLLLANAGISGPYVLVGHSFGGLNVLLYASQYPEEVVGMVLVDSTHEDQPFIPYPFILRAGTLLAPLLAPLGVIRLLSPIFLSANPVYAKGSKYPPAYKGIVAHTRHTNTYRKEYLCFEQSLSEGRAAVKPLGDMPLVVLTARRESPAERQSEQEAVWRGLQAKLAQKSSRGKQVIVENSSHFIQYDRPEAVIDAVHEVVETVRGKSAGV